MKFKFVTGILRAGTLTRWIGSTRQIEGAQESAKKLITRSITIFESVDDFKKVGEAETELGYCYWREGAMDDARVLLTQALSDLEDETGDPKAVAYLRSLEIATVMRGRGEKGRQECPARVDPRFVM